VTLTVTRNPAVDRILAFDEPMVPDRVMRAPTRAHSPSVSFNVDRRAERHLYATPDLPAETHMESFDEETLAMSESIGIAVLVGFTVIVTAVVGMNVLVADQFTDDGGPQANFTYDYVADNELLLVTHSRGDQLEAGRIEFRGPGDNVTWAQLANRNETAPVGPGDITQLSQSNRYNRRVSARDTITIYYNQNGNRTQLDQWDGA